MTNVPSFDYTRAESLHSALVAVQAGAIPIQGGTELLPAMALGLIAPTRLVSLSALDELRNHQLQGDRLILGAALTHRAIAGSAEVQQSCPLLAEVAEGVGNIRVRSTGTLGGSLAFGEPRSDITTALLALDAEVRLTALSGERRLLLKEFMLGPYEVDLLPEELITAIEIPVNQVDFSVYRKVVLSERPVVSVALVRLRTSHRWRMVVGAVSLSPTIVEIEHLSDLRPEAAVGGMDVVRDLSGSEEYKRHLTAVMIERCRAVAEMQFHGNKI